jgi:hypothetical protein
MLPAALSFSGDADRFAVNRDRVSLHEHVRRVNYIAGTTEAVVIFENAAVSVGRFCSTSAPDLMDLPSTVIESRCMSTLPTSCRRTLKGIRSGAEVEHRVRGLAPETQEAIIQQEFEKIAPVRRVNYIAGTKRPVGAH